MGSRDHLDALKAAADPDRVAADLGLRGRGRRFFCPSCQPDGGKTPDLSVRGEGVHCWKCGWKGDLLKLIEVTAKVDFQGAVAWLENQTGIRPPTRRKRAGKAPEKRTEQGECLDKGKAVGDDPVASCAPGGACVDVLGAFLEACRPVEGAALDWLKGKVPGLSPDLIEGLRLRFCGTEYQDIMAKLRADHGDDALLAAGLAKRSKTGQAVPSFWHYFTRKAGFLVIPYLLDGRPVFLKVRPPVSKEEAESRHLVRFLNTAAAVPCLYNVDALAVRPVPDRVLICEGESDTWTALSHGFAAVGSPGARTFKSAWVEAFRPFWSPTDIDEERAAIYEFDAGMKRDEADRLAAAGRRSTVVLVLDGDPAGQEGARIVADLFRKAGLPVPLKMAIPAGTDLSGYMAEEQKDGPA